MKNFNREAIQRMFDGRKGGGGGGTNNADLAGYATQMWVNQNYVSIEFFNRLFSIHGHDPEDESTPPTDISVLPNDMDSIVDSIESMVGFWTEEYLSALGLNSEQGGGGITLNAALASINNSPLGNPTGTNTVLMFNGTTWVYTSMGSTDMNTVWTALADGTDTHQINISHLTTALSGYATTSQLSDYATVTDLEQLASYFNTLSGYFTNGAANEAVKLETARTIWGQQFDGTANITGDITQATCLEFSGIAGTATNGGFIDFHYAGGGADYTSRIIEDVSGVLKINNTIWAQLSGNVSIGTSTISQTYKLDVAGYTKTTRLYLADGVYLEYDSTNSGVHLVGAGFYSDSYVSALGVNSGGGGGGSDYIPLTGSSSITGTLAPSVATADLGSSTNKWRNIYATSLSISNTLTTYALTVNSSATVAGSITATNGNLVASTGYVSSAGGYKVTGKDDTSVLLAGGGTKPLSEIGSAYTLPAATAAALGGLKVNQSYGQAATVQASGNTGTRNYGLQIDSNGMGFVYVPWENTDNDTKNTAGATNLTATKMYLVGATEQSTNPQTYSNSNCYIGTDNCLYSGGSKVLTSISSSDVTTALGFTPAATSDLNNYLPLTGGTLTGQLTVNNTIHCKELLAYDSRYWTQALFVGSGHDGLGGNYTGGLIYVYGNEPLHIYTNRNSRMYIGGDGNVGIGTTSPSYNLHVIGTVYATTFIKSGGTASQFLKADGSVDNNTYLTTTPTSLAVTSTLTVEGNAVWSAGDFSLKSYTSLQDLGWVSDTADAKKVVTSNALAYWNGKYNSANRSNLAYCNQGAFGSMATENASDYVKDISGYAYITNHLVVSGGSTVAAPNEKLYVNGASYLKGFLNSFAHTIKDSVTENDALFVGSGFDGLGRNYTGGLIYVYGNEPLHIYTNRNSRMYIGGDGNVGIGSNNPSYLLHVAGTFYASGDSAFGGTLSMAGNITPSTDGQYSLGTSSKRFSAVYAGSFVKTGGTSSQFLKADGSVDSNTYLTTTPTNMTISQSLTVGTKCLLQSGMKGLSICYECASDGTPDNNRTGEINRYSNTIHLQYDSGTGGVTMCRQGFLFTNPGTTSQLSTSNNNLQIAVGTGDAYVDKAWVINSDMRKKDIAQYINIDINSIADAPVFNFTWKNDITRQLTLGTSAQYWQKVFPNAVRTTPDGYLGMDYSSIALASAVLTARKVVDHEARIRLLEVENAALRNEINQLKKVA